MSEMVTKYQLFIESLSDEEKARLAAADEPTKQLVGGMIANDTEFARLLIPPAPSDEVQQDISEDAKRKALTVHEIIAKKSSNEQLKLFAPYPTEFTRTHPFFPMSTKEMAKRPHIEDMIIADHSWGTLKYTGPKLSIYDEDALMVLLATINSDTTTRGGEIYSGSLSELAKRKGISKPGQNHLNDLYSSYKRMNSASFELNIGEKRKGGGKKDKGGTSTVNNIISNVTYDRKKGDISIAVNPYFKEMYCKDRVTWLDVLMRIRINSPIAKALFKFIMSHRDDRWDGPVKLVASTINMDLDLPMNKIRERLKNAIKELVENGVLLPVSSIAGDQITLIRVPRKPLSGGKTIA